jgi:hypothetical protein
MFEGTMSHNPVRVSLPATCAGSEMLLPLAQREYYFGFYFFPYAPVVGRWSA